MKFAYDNILIYLDFNETVEGGRCYAKNNSTLLLTHSFYNRQLE